MAPVTIDDDTTDEPHGDIPHDSSILEGFQAYLDGGSPHFVVEVIHVTTRDSVWLRIRPISIQAQEGTPLWAIGHGECWLLDPSSKAVTGAQGTCNGYITTVPSPGHTIGKLDYFIPEH